MSEAIEITSLAKLAAVDSEMKDYFGELEAIPARVKQLKENVETLQALLTTEKGKLAEAESLLATQAKELEEHNFLLSRARSKSAHAQNTREADAADREREGLRRSVKEREDEYLKLTESIEAVRASVSKHEQELGELQTLTASECQTAEARLAELEAKKQSVEQKRGAMTGDIPRSILARYERIRVKKGTGVAGMQQGTCQACRMKLPPQLAIHVQRGEEPLQCPSCMRFLIFAPVLAEFMPDEEESGAQDIPAESLST